MSYHSFIMRKHAYCNCKFILSGCYLILEINTTPDYILYYTLPLCLGRQETTFAYLGIRIRRPIALQQQTLINIIKMNVYNNKIHLC